MYSAWVELLLHKYISQEPGWTFVIFRTACVKVCNLYQLQKFSVDTLSQYSNLWARVNQHPPVHQLTVLFIGWAAFFHRIPDLVLTQHCNTINLFGLLTFDPFYFVGCFFLNLTILPSNLITSLIPYLPYWPSYIVDLHFDSTYKLLTYLFSYFSWLNLSLG